MILATFWNSTWVSLLTAVIGAIVGALVCYALLGVADTNPLRARSSTPPPASWPSSAASCSPSRGSRRSACRGVVTLLLKNAGIDIFADGPWIYELPGLILPYIYFQIPLMVITFMPALSALKPQWAEANLTLGGTRASFWVRIGIPVLAPSFLASFLLLFANAFSSYATAAALASQDRPSSRCRSARRSPARPSSGARTSPARSPSA